MPEIIVKNTPYNPDQYPEQKLAEKKGLAKWEKIKDDVGKDRIFESEGHKRDYLRRVASNPGNVPGIPPFLPAVGLQSSLAGLKVARGCSCGGCAIASDNFYCPKCKKHVEDKDEN